MATCNIVSGYTIDCRENIGGIDAVYFAEFGTMTILDSSGTVTGITKATGKKFWKYEVPVKSSAVANSNPTASIDNGTFFYEQSVELPINKRDATTRNIITTLGKNKLIVITKDKDSVYRMYGKQFGMYMATGSGKSGVALGDANGYGLKFEGMEVEDFFVVSSTVASALETVGV